MLTATSGSSVPPAERWVRRAASLADSVSTNIADPLASNHRLAQPYAGLRRLADRDALVAQEHDRGDAAP
jgi:hypothetical protein